MGTDFASEIISTSNPQIRVIRLQGELDEVSTEKLQGILDPFLADLQIKNIIFDFSNLRFINSKGIGFLVAIHTHLSKDGRVLTLVSANEAVMDVISLVGLTTIIPYFDSLEEVND